MKILDTLQKGELSPLLTVGDEGQIYGTPLNYLYQNHATGPNDKENYTWRLQIKF